MKKRDKQLVQVVVGTVAQEDSIETLVRMLEQAQHRVSSEGLSDARIDIDKVTTGGYYPQESIVVQILAWRDETDEEYDIRMGTAKLSKERQEASERAEYVRLKAKYEKDA